MSFADKSRRVTITKDRPVLDVAEFLLSTIGQSACGPQDLSTGGNNAEYGVVYADGQADMWQYPCHKKFMYLEPADKPVVSFSKFKRYKTGSDAGGSSDFYYSCKAYFDWITSTDVSNPWRHVLYSEGVSTKYRKSDFMWKEGFIFDNLDKLPTNHHHQFMVASRMQKEWPYLVELWHRLVTEYGYKPAWAFAYISMWFWSDEGKNDGYNKYQGFFNWKSHKPITETLYDYPIDMNVCDEAYVLNFLRGKMVGEANPTFQKRADYTPVNSLWGQNKLGHGSESTYMVQFQKRYADKFTDTTREVNSSFSGTKTTVKEKKILIHDLIAIGLEEQKRLYSLV